MPVCYFEDALVCMTHVASQLSYRWLPEPCLTPMDESDLSTVLERGVDFRDYDLAAWRRFVEFVRDERSELAPWLLPFEASRTSDRLPLAIHSHLAQVQSAGASYVPITSPLYPALLRDIADPPLALTIAGEVRLLNGTHVSIVGSRKASGLALTQSFELGRNLASSGHVVVSGGAYGCDIAAHQGVLATRVCPAPAVVVFAGGLQDLYPRGNSAVFRALAASRAAFISERLWDAACRPLDFAARNRIIAGLSCKTFVMQAARKSGAMITARLALDQGRDVAVLLHPAGDVRASGSQALVAEGAQGFLDASAIIAKI